MKQVLIENPVLNSPFAEPTRHHRFDDEGITNDVVEGRRTSSYFIPVPRSRKKGPAQPSLPLTEWTEDRIQENRLVNQIRPRISMWRRGGYLGVTPTTARLLQYWTAPDLGGNRVWSEEPLAGCGQPDERQNRRCSQGGAP